MPVTRCLSPTLPQTSILLPTACPGGGGVFSSFIPREGSLVPDPGYAEGTLAPVLTPVPCGHQSPGLVPPLTAAASHPSLQPSLTDASFCSFTTQDYLLRVAA